LTNAALGASSSTGLNPSPDVQVKAYSVDRDGFQMPVRWYTRGDSSPGSAAVYIHGGGMVCGNLDVFEPIVRYMVQQSGVPFLAVGYRLAPEHPGTGPAEDAFAGYRWLLDHAAELGVDPARVALMGDSGGGGIGAGAAILARDNGVPLAKQILICPMLDDRNVEPDPLLAPTATWGYDNNFTGWNALLGDRRGGLDVPPDAAPARLTDFAGLAPAYIEVGELDLFRDESLSYAQRLLSAGVSCEFHLHPGAPHGYEWLNQGSALSKRALAERFRVLQGL
jgi:acetyl esterase/lipase